MRRRDMLAAFGAASATILSPRRALADEIEYEYDALGRLVRVTYDNGATIEYSYDLAGNRRVVTRSASPPPPFNTTIAITGTGPVNLRALADANGYTGLRPATVLFTLANTVTITGAAGGGVGITTGAWPTESYAIALSLQISGIVRGGGGNGGEGGGMGNSAMPGGAGGDAISCLTPISIIVNSGGQVRAGGGGGGGGGMGEGGWPEPEYYGGGGGGGGSPNGAGGPGGNAPNGGGGAGGSGSVAAGGAGGSAMNAGVGGAGGAIAAAGANGSGWLSPPAPGGAGGAAGYAIRKNGRTVPVTNNGAISGAVG